MIPTFTRGITVLHGTGYRFAPGYAPAERFNLPELSIPEGHARASVRVRAEGKTYVWATAPSDARLSVEWALAWSARIWSYVDEEEFRRLAALMRLSGREIETALSTIEIHDDCFFRRPGSLEVTPEKVRGWDRGH